MSMLIQEFDSIKAGIDVKSNLLIFKDKLKSQVSHGLSTDAMSGEYGVFTALLDDEDPKIRKNAVQILGLLGNSAAFDDIYKAYLKEETNYNKSAYIKAMSALDYLPHIEELTQLYNALKNEEVTEDNRKHRIEELHAFSLMLLEQLPDHSFTGHELVNEFVLLTNRNFKGITVKELGRIPHKEFTAGVMVKTKQLDYVLNNVRTYSELLFKPDDITDVSAQPEEAARELIAAGLTDYIQARISSSDSPIAFRVDYKTQDIKKKSDFEHRISSELEYLSKWQLINSTGSYELELRFIDSAAGRPIVLLRFCMLKDRRFDYRRMTLPVSMKPSLAALLMQLGHDYFKDNAAVCDPFCGCGTMLVERDRLMSTRIMYGIDIFQDAIKAAAVNIQAAGLKSKTELVTRDFFDFRHDYRFDEIVTDMPFVTGQKASADIEAIYRKFFNKLPSVMEEEGHLFIYSRNRSLLRKYALEAHVRIIAEYEISKVEGSYFYILQYNKA